MSDERIPREAIKVAYQFLGDYSWPLAEGIVEAVEPHLRAQWEKELLSDETITRMAYALHKSEVQVRHVLRAALGEDT